jgi:magnesium chelatase family protein
LRGRALRHACRLSGAAAHRLIRLAEGEGASGRGTERLLRVARTIADLRDRDAVETEDLDEAAWFRSEEARSAGALAS